MFFFFDDPEGPNLLVVMVMAAIIYVPSLAGYTYWHPVKQDGLKKLLLLILGQIILVTIFYVCLR